MAVNALDVALIPFKSPQEDILFSLNKVADTQCLPHWDSDTCRDILAHFSSFAEAEIAPLDETGDAEGCQFVNGSVQMPAGFTEAYARLLEGGWQGLSAPEAFGGMGQNKLIAAAVSEVFSGANHAMQMVCNLVPGAISTLLQFGTASQQQQWIPRLASGTALSTMCLTEPGAGSDLARIQTKATCTNGEWELSGEKVFISGGDQNLSEDIIHLVLARSGTNGIKGLSLFLCSKAESGDTIRVARIEEKLGLHASPTCHMVFDRAPAELIGEEGDGLTAMFTVMNHARIDVALQGVAHAARAYDIAHSYATQRVQGRQHDGSDAVLSDHADVRRMLDEQRTLSLGARSMAHIALLEMERSEQTALIEFLTPLCKVFCTEAGIRCADLGIQILGGYGYLGEYRVGQTWRDARITAIYEGANGIHELAIATRGLRWQSGAGADQFDKLVCALATENTALVHKINAWREERAKMLLLDDPSAQAHQFAQATAELFFRAVWERIASVSDDAELKRLYTVVCQR